MHQLPEAHTPDDRVEFLFAWQVGQALWPPLFLDDHPCEREPPRERVEDVALMPAKMVAVAEDCDPRGSARRRRPRPLCQNGHHVAKISSYTRTGKKSHHHNDLNARKYPQRCSD